MERVPFDPERKKFTHGAETLASERHPERNEDNMLVLPEQGFFAVFDGASAHRAGEVASALGAEFMEDELEGAPDALDPEKIREFLEGALRNVSRHIYEVAKVHPEHGDMAATASVVQICERPDGVREAIVGNVGDSRVYHLTTEGRIHQVTLDDGLVRKDSDDEESARKLQAKIGNAADPSRLNLREHNLLRGRDYITQALGNPDIIPRMHSVAVFPGEVIALLTDGVSDNLTDEEIKTILKESPSAEAAADALVSAAYGRSRTDHFRKKQDDMTAVVVKMD